MILVIGGDYTYDLLKPTFLSFGKGGGVDVEKCVSGKGMTNREEAIGDILDGHFVICGGMKFESSCVIFGKNEPKLIQRVESNRKYEAAIKLNQSMMWITGGTKSRTTEFVTINSSKKGITLPFEISYHCMIMFKKDFILLIGGKYRGNGYWDQEDYSTRTWIIDQKCTIKGD